MKIDVVIPVYKPDGQFLELHQAHKGPDGGAVENHSHEYGKGALGRLVFRTF